jgi:hypothetical protein
MPMIDVYSASGTFGDPHALALALASELMAIEQAPDIPMFRKNTAAFVHEMPSGSLSNVDGDSTYSRAHARDLRSRKACARIMASTAASRIASPDESILDRFGRTALSALPAYISGRQVS